MSEKEKQIMNTIIEGLPKMSEFEKGYVLGIVEGKVSEKEQKKDGGQKEKMSNLQIFSNPESGNARRQYGNLFPG